MIENIIDDEDIDDFNNILIKRHDYAKNGINELIYLYRKIGKIPLEILAKYWIRYYTSESSFYSLMNLQFMENKYGVREARKRIYVTTDKTKGALKVLAKKERYTTFVIPNNIGGRYSVLTAVGLLPIATAGINIDKLMEGARFAMDKYSDNNVKYNDCYKYAVIRNILYNNKKNIEILVTYEPKLHYFIEWWKQLFGESEGKDKKGIYPSGAEFTTDLHSLGQYIQEGKRMLFETVIKIEKQEANMIINYDEDNLDELNYLHGKTMDYVNSKAMEATILAHEEGGVPNIVINVEELNEELIKEESEEGEEESRKRFGRKGKSAKSADEQGDPDLTKLKKHDMLEIMLAQSKEIDRLRERVADLEAQLESREFEFSKIGSIAEASLAVTNIFKEAEKAAVIYIENIRRRCEEEK